MEIDLLVKMMRAIGYSMVALAFVLLLLGIYNRASWVSGEGRKPSLHIGAFIMLFVGGLLVSGASMGVVVIMPGQAGVVFDQTRGLLPNVLTRDGIHFIVPYLQTVRIYDIRKRTYEMSSQLGAGQHSSDDSLDVQSAEGMTLKFDLTVIYRVDPQKLLHIYKTMADDFDEKIIRPKIRAVFREVTTKYKVTDLITKRGELVNTALLVLREAISKDGFILDDVLLRKIILPEDYMQVLREKQIEEQNALKMKFVLDKEAQIAKQKEVIAIGQKMAIIRIAEGEAQAMELIAKAKAAEVLAMSESEAAGMRLKAEALNLNPHLVNQTIAERLSDNIQFMVVPSDSKMFFMDALKDMGMSLGDKK